MQPGKGDSKGKKVLRAALGPPPGCTPTQGVGEGCWLTPGAGGPHGHGDAPAHTLAGGAGPYPPTPGGGLLVEGKEGVRELQTGGQG